MAEFKTRQTALAHGGKHTPAALRELLSGNSTHPVPHAIANRQPAG